MAKTRDKIVNQAKAWLGYKESNGTHKKIIDVYNSHKPLARGYKVTYTDAWCATFVSACAIKCGYTDLIPTECGCGPYIDLLEKKGIWVENDAYKPSPGDLIFYDWDDNGIGDNKGAPDHVGIVEKVKGNTIMVIEGNKGTTGSVARREVPINGKYIRGFGVPKYETKQTTNKAPTPTKKTTYTTWTGVVTPPEGLNVRKGAGVKYGKITALIKGTKVTVNGTDKDDKGNEWYKISTSKIEVGYVMSKYIKKV